MINIASSDVANLQVSQHPQSPIPVVNLKPVKGKKLYSNEIGCVGAHRVVDLACCVRWSRNNDKCSEGFIRGKLPPSYFKNKFAIKVICVLIPKSLYGTFCIEFYNRQMTIKQFNCSKPGKCPSRLYILGFNPPWQNPMCQKGTSKLTCPKVHSRFPLHMHVQSWSSLVSCSDPNLPIIWNSCLPHASHLSANPVCPITEIWSETINIYHVYFSPGHHYLLPGLLLLRGSSSF